MLPSLRTTQQAQQQERDFADLRNQARSPSPSALALLPTTLSSTSSTGSIPIFLVKGGEFDVQNTPDVPTTPNPNDFAPSPVLGTDFEPEVSAPAFWPEGGFVDRIGERTFDTFGYPGGPGFSPHSSPKKSPRKLALQSALEHTRREGISGVNEVVDEVDEEERELTLEIVARGSTRHLRTPRRATPLQRADVAEYLKEDEDEDEDDPRNTPLARLGYGPSEPRPSCPARSPSVGSSCFTISAYYDAPSADGEHSEGRTSIEVAPIWLHAKEEYAPMSLHQREPAEVDRDAGSASKMRGQTPKGLVDLRPRPAPLPLTNFSRPTFIKRPSPQIASPQSPQSVMGKMDPQHYQTTYQHRALTPRSSKLHPSPPLPPMPLSAQSNISSFTTASETTSSSAASSTAASSVSSLGFGPIAREGADSELPLSLSFLAGCTIELWVDQEGFRSIRPQMRLLRYSARGGLDQLPPAKNDKSRPGSSKARKSLGSSHGSAPLETGVIEFGMMKTESWMYHHTTFGSAPLLRRLTLNEDDSKDYLSRHATLKISENGVYSVKGSEDRDRLRWKFEYVVADKRNKAGGIIQGEKCFTPLLFSCTPELLRPERGMKVKLLHVVKKTVFSNLESSKRDSPPRAEASTTSTEEQSVASPKVVSNLAQALVQAVSRPVTPKRPPTPNDRPKTPKRPITPKDILRPTTPSEQRQRSSRGLSMRPTTPKTPKDYRALEAEIQYATAPSSFAAQMKPREGEHIPRIPTSHPRLTTIGRPRAASHSTVWDNPRPFGKPPVLSPPLTKPPVGGKIATPLQIKEWLSSADRTPSLPSSSSRPLSRLPTPTGIGKGLTAMPPPRSVLRAPHMGLPKRPSTSRL